ncbi:MAG: OPT/YSL family transporter, partial [Myxococcaceae bacterium]
AFDLLAANKALTFSEQPVAHLSDSPFRVFLWLSVAGLLGVLLAVPMRRYYIDQEKLTFADGTAAGETLLVLDEGAAGAKRQLRWLIFGGLFSFIFSWFRDGEPKFIPSGWAPPAQDNRWVNLRVGAELSPLSFGSGVLVGLRITASMAIGMVIAWIILPGPLFNASITSALDFKETLRWVMWPATGLMVSGGLTALALNWKSIAATVKDLRKADTKGSDFPMSWVIIGSIVLSIALIIVQKISLGIAVWESAVAIIISIPLMLVGIRVLGETNWAPISSMANMVQAIFAAISPGNIASNMVASGMSGTVAGSGETLMQDYRAGKIVGSTNRHLTYMQLIATPVGALAVALAYPLLKHQYGIGPARYGLTDEAAKHSVGKGLPVPISVKWAGFAELLSKGLDNLPKYAGWALLFGVILGIVITIFEKKYKDYLPSPMGIAFGMLIPATSVVPMVLGGIVQMLWHKANKKHEEEVSTPLASGLIVGEAMVALLLPILATLALLEPLHDLLLPLTNWVNEKLHMTLFIKGD